MSALHELSDKHLWLLQTRAIRWNLLTVKREALCWSTSEEQNRDYWSKVSTWLSVEPSLTWRNSRGSALETGVWFQTHGGEISVVDCSFITQGELAQMVERSLSMREVAGSMPAFSRVLLTLYCLLCGGKCLCSDCRTQTMSLGRWCAERGQEQCHF